MHNEMLDNEMLLKIDIYYINKYLKYLNGLSYRIYIIIVYGNLK